MKQYSIRKIFFLYRVQIVLLIILVIGAYARLIQLHGLLWAMVGYDESRDMLVAKHIVEFGESLWRGPFASGGLDVLLNSPFYYYCIAVLWFFTHSAYGALCAWALIMLSVVYIGYKIGQNIWDSTTGLCIAALLAVHPELIKASKQLGQPNILIVWVVLMLWFLTHKKKLYVVDLFVLVFTAFLALHLHYAALLLLPVFIPWVIWSWWRRRASYHPMVVFMAPVVSIGYSILIWVLFTYRSVAFDQLTFFQVNVSPETSRYQTFVSVVRETVQLVWENLPVQTALLYVCISVFIIYVWSIRGKLKPMFRLNVHWLLISICIPIFVFSAYIGPVSPTYLLCMIPIYIVLLGLALRIVIYTHRYIGICLMFLTVSYFGMSTYDIYKIPNQKNMYLNNSLVAQAIYKDFMNIPIAFRFFEIMENGERVPSFRLATLSPDLVFDGWGTPSTWFWLEEIFSVRLISIDSSVTNVSPRISIPKYFYVICDHRNTGPKNASQCLRRFVNARSYISKEYISVYVSDSYSVWRFDILEKPKDGIYNVAYDELLHPKE